MNEKNELFAGPAVMLFSAALFGFFGIFYVDWNALGVDGQVVLFRVLLGWTLKISAGMFAVAGVITFSRPRIGNLLYTLTGIASAGLFVVVAVMDVTDERHGFMPYGPVVLLLFAAWNGYGSWSALRSIFGSRWRTHAVPGGPEPAGDQ